MSRPRPCPDVPELHANKATSALHKLVTGAEGHRRQEMSGAELQATSQGTADALPICHSTTTYTRQVHQCLGVAPSDWAALV